MMNLCFMISSFMVTSHAHLSSDHPLGSCRVPTAINGHDGPWPWSPPQSMVQKRISSTDAVFIYRWVLCTLQRFNRYDFLQSCHCFRYNVSF